MSALLLSYSSTAVSAPETKALAKVDQHNPESVWPLWSCARTAVFSGFGFMILSVAFRFFPLRIAVYTTVLPLLSFNLLSKVKALNDSR